MCRTSTALARCAGDDVLEMLVGGHVRFGATVTSQCEEREIMGWSGNRNSEHSATVRLRNRMSTVTTLFLDGRASRRCHLSGAHACVRGAPKNHTTSTGCTPYTSRSK